jgi:iron complex transport system substrate-binding protein
MRRARRLCFALLPGLLVAWGAAGAASGAASGAARIVSIGGALTETVYALGLGGALVGTDSTSTYPASARRLPKVGYARTLGAEAVLSLAPTLVLASEDAGPPEALEQIRRVGVTVRVVPVGLRPEGVPAMIVAVAQALGVAERGEALQRCVADQLRGVTGPLAEVTVRPRVLFLLSTGGGEMLTSGAGTRANAIIRLAGGRNAVEGYEGYKPLSAEAALAAQPELLLLTTEGFQVAGGMDALRRHAGLAATPALRAGAVAHQDGLLLLGLGPRTAQAVRWLAERLHPEVAWPTAPPAPCVPEQRP